MRFFALLAFLFVSAAPARAQAQFFDTYAIGSPSLTEVWVDPVHGSDAASGRSRSEALRSLQAAWQRIPASTPLTGSGFHVKLTSGEYPREAMPNYWEHRWGSASAPVLFEAVDGPGTAILLGDVNMFDTRYAYFLNVTIAPNPPGDAFHCERCDHILLRGVTLNGGAGRNAHETLKVNQSTNFFIEGSDISGADDNAIDFVSVQGGHILRNRIHNAEDWCIYTKGGSASLRIEGNEIFNCGTGGYTAGQGTGFEFMSSPFLHFEAYDIKFFNNIVHDTEGAGFGVNGGYNILIAHNTFYRVGSRSHGMEIVFGSRSCDGNSSECASRVAAGGWGTASSNVTVPIPNRNVFVFNNLLYNPPGFRSQWQHFAIPGPQGAPAGSNVPSPARTDTNLRITGNVLWNGPTDLPLGIGSDSGCSPENPTCSELQLRRENSVNSLTPDFTNFAGGDVAPGAALASVEGASIPSFPGGDRESSPLAPEGLLSNQVLRDFSGRAREGTPRVGALLSGSDSHLPSTFSPSPGGANPTPPDAPPPSPPPPPSIDRSPQLSAIVYTARNGRITVSALATRLTRASLIITSRATGRIRQYRVLMTREDRSGTRRIRASAVLNRSRSRTPELYGVTLFVANSFGDRSVSFEDAASPVPRGR